MFEYSQLVPGAKSGSCPIAIATSCVGVNVVSRSRSKLAADSSSGKSCV